MSLGWIPTEVDVVLMIFLPLATPFTLEFARWWQPLRFGSAHALSRESNGFLLQGKLSHQKLSSDKLLLNSNSICWDARVQGHEQLAMSWNKDPRRYRAPRVDAALSSGLPFSGIAVTTLGLAYCWAVVNFGALFLLLLWLLYLKPTRNGVDTADHVTIVFWLVTLAVA